LLPQLVFVEFPLWQWAVVPVAETKAQVEVHLEEIVILMFQPW
jgi:hypothetical protein